jgi:hypothetical protein
MKKVIFILIILSLLGVGSYFLFFHLTKDKAIKIIVAAASGRTSATYATFGDEYLIAWAKAIKAKSPSFVDGGKTYDTLTGKSK